MAKLCKDYIVDLNTPRLDLSFWLEDMFKTYKFSYYTDPKIVMGTETFKAFQLITKEITLTIRGARMYKFKEYDIPQRWIMVDQFADPYYISIKWENPEVKTYHHLYGHSIQHVFYDDIIGLDHGHGFQRVPHIDHVKFNGPATIVFWKDGTKTVVKHDGKGRKDKKQAILYAFIRKIYGEGKPYHNILNEIEEAVK